MGNSKLGRGVYGKIYITAAKMFPIYNGLLITSVILNNKVKTISELTEYIHFLISNTNMKLMPKPKMKTLEKSVRLLIDQGQLKGYDIIDDSIVKV